MKRPYILILSIVLLLGGAISSLINQNTAATRAQNIVTLDNAGQPINNLLEELKGYVENHTAASVTFGLRATYLRELQAVSVTPMPASNSELYRAGQAACAGRTSSITQANCVNAYVSERLVAATPTPTPAPTPKPEDYTYRFTSPMLALDAAGIMLVSGSLLLLAWVMLKIFKRGEHV